jgi:hypothetical protein
VRTEGLAKTKTTAPPIEGKKCSGPRTNSDQHEMIGTDIYLGTNKPSYQIECYQMAKQIFLN